MVRIVQTWAAVGAIFVAIGVGVILRSGPSEPAARATATKREDGRRVTYVIGDLHGDEECARYWVDDRLDLVDWKSASESGNSDKHEQQQQQQKPQWRQPHASLVFMGDYCDKGPNSRQTMLFVKSLTDHFPERVTALMGNHELELLRDRDPGRIDKFMHLVFAAVHPEEYRHYDLPWEESDQHVVELLINASLEVYANRWHSYVTMAPPLALGKEPPTRQIHSIVELLDESIRPQVAGRLHEYQNAYLAAYAPNTTLGQWVQSLKVAHIENGVFFCHGGLFPAVVDAIEKVGGVDALNAQARQYAASSPSWNEFLDHSEVGQAIDGMLSFRGNHDERSNCGNLPALLQRLQGVNKLAVGHTPKEQVRSMCEDQFWALDSLLGRWIRTSGNFYCPMDGRKSTKGSFVCNPLVKGCQGQVVKMWSDGSVEIIQ